MKIAVIGASGNVGTRITTEALSRGHEVTAVVRDPSKLPARNKQSVAKGDVTKPTELAKVLAGHDAVVSAVTFLETVPQAMLDAIRQSGVSRYLSVGGAGSLWESPHTLFVDSASFPREVLEESHRGRALLAALEQEIELDWTMLTPAAEFLPGERTGSFRLGTDTLVKCENGRSWISYEDFAIAMLDEIERPANRRRRFTIGY